MHVFLKSEFNWFLREAVRVSRQASGTEICGLLIDTGVHLSFLQTRNTSARVGSFAFSPAEVRRVVAATKVLGQEVVGTFHSHPVGVSIPGKLDIDYAVNDSLMFLFDCLGSDGRLWRIRGGRAHPLDFGFVHRSHRPPNHSMQRTGASRLAQSQSVRQRRLAPAADADR
jgi:proteasome lid subunit RPN8/RPN11